MRPTDDAVAFRITFNTVRDAAEPIATVAIDTDRAGGQGDDAWPREAGLTTPGVEHFVTSWDGGGEVTHAGGGPAEQVGSAKLDPDTNQLTVRVPESVLDPGTGTWRLTAGGGLRGGGDTYVITTETADTSQPGTTTRTRRGAVKTTPGAEPPRPRAA